MASTTVNACPLPRFSSVDTSPQPAVFDVRVNTGIAKCGGRYERWSDCEEGTCVMMTVVLELAVCLCFKLESPQKGRAGAPL